MRTAVIVALVFAVGLAFTTIYVLRQPPRASSAPVAWLSGLSESSTDDIRFSWGDKSDDIRVVGDGMSGWKMERSRMGGGVVQWPVQAAHVRGGLRLLSDMATLAHSDNAVMRNAQTTLIAFSRGGREVGSIRIATKGLGGQAPAIIGDVPPRFVMVDEAMSRAFLREGVLQWRTALVFPGMAGGASRITISNPSARVELVRVQGRWLVADPIQTPGSDGAMKALLATLGTLPISKFVDDATADDARLGMDAPMASIRVESELRRAGDGGVRREVLVERMEVGGPADVARTTMFVRVGATIERDGQDGGRAWGPVVCVVERSRLDAISGDAGAYASRAVVRESAADILRLRVVDPKGERVGCVRTIDGWFEATEGDAPGTKVDGERAKAIQQLIDVLCGERASEVRGDAGMELEVVGSLELGVSEGPLPTVEVVRGVLGAKSQMGLLVKGVVRLYGEADERAIEASVRAIAGR